jgi:hypothetical protein
MHGGRNVFKILIQWYINIININLIINLGLILKNNKVKF